MTTQHTHTTSTVSASVRNSDRAALSACRAVGRVRSLAVLAVATMVPLFVAASPWTVGGLNPLGLVAIGHAQAPQAPLNRAGGQPEGPPVTPKPGGPLTPSDTTYKVDAIEFFLTPDQFVEYKFRLKPGARMVFNWKASGPVEVDFHTVPDGKPVSASETFMRGQASSGSGDYRSPYAGLHGWYWKNTSKEEVKIVLNASGFWTEAWMFSGDPVGEQMPLQDPPPPEY